MDISLPTTGVAEQAADGWQVGQLLGAVRRRAWLIGLLAAAGAAAAYGGARTVPKSFTASAQVAVEGERVAIPELKGVLRNDSPGDPMPWVRTETLAITSRDLVMQVTNELHLRERPEFNPDLRPHTALGDAIARAKAAALSLLPKHEAADEAPAQTDEIVLGEAMRALSVFNDGRSLIILVSFTSQDPKLSADFANRLATAYIASRGGRRTAANEDANKSLTARVETARNDLADIERQMRDLRSRNELVGVRAGSIGQQQAEELATATARAGVEAAQLQTQYDRAAALAGSGSSDALASVLNSPTISSLRQQEGTARSKMADLGARYGSGYPGVRAASAELAAAQRGVQEETRRIIASLGSQLGAAKAQLAGLQKQLADARRAGVTSENAAAQLLQLQQEATTRRALYQTLLERAQQTVAQPSSSGITDVRVVSQAAAPLYPSAPNMKVATGAGGVGGGLLGVLLALTVLRPSARMREPGDIRALLGFPVTAVLRRGLIGRGRTGIAARVVQDPGGPEAEALRSLRVQLGRLGRVARPRSFVFAGSAEDGSAFPAAVAVAVALARVVALDGDRVLLIEGNLRRPRATAVLAQRAEGLRSVLTEGQSWRDRVQRDGGAPMDVLAVTQPLDGTHALLGSEQFQNLLSDAQADYDLVVLTAPPATAADTVLLAGRADVTALVLQGGLDDREALLGAVGALGRASRCKLAFVMVSA